MSGSTHELRTPTGTVIHPTAIVEDGCIVGSGTRVWHHTHVRAGSTIGADCTLGFSVFVDTGVTIGDRCKIQNHASVYQGVTLEDDVFVGPAAVFTNDLYPRANPDDWDVVPTVVRTGASIGANATIVCGVDVGEWALVAAGAVVTSDVPPHGLVTGNPARLQSWICVCARRLAAAGSPVPNTCPHCGRPTEGVGS